MKTNFTQMIFVLDRSGSMQGLEKDTIGGFNSLIEKQKLVAGEAVVTTVLFDDAYDILHDSKDIQAVQPMTDKDYFVRGSTALLDAVGKTINHVGVKLFGMQENMRPDKVVVVIITDGMENASREFTSEKVKSMIEHQKSVYNWEFMFLGANIDALQVASTYGINKECAVEYACDRQGTELNFKCVNNAMHCLRSSGKLEPQWKSDIQEHLDTQKSKPTAKTTKHAGSPAPMKLMTTNEIGEVISENYLKTEGCPAPMTLMATNVINNKTIGDDAMQCNGNINKKSTVILIK